ncbi:helix-turn-helix transcriptional regulator [Pectinatus frisingensis]|uniref:helix-turn-helix transcriptional regulator n=1 Tax=Pectinatus frisingensis TaxID=865 RepID=UPI003D80185F
MRTLLVKYRGKRSQFEMAEIYGVTQQAWSGWEKGLYKPNVTIMKKIELDSGISMEDIFFDVFNKNKLLKIKESA